MLQGRLATKKILDHVIVSDINKHSSSFNNGINKVKCFAVQPLASFNFDGHPIGSSACCISTSTIQLFALVIYSMVK